MVKNIFFKVSGEKNTCHKTSISNFKEEALDLIFGPMNVHNKMKHLGWIKQVWILGLDIWILDIMLEPNPKSLC